MVVLHRPGTQTVRQFCSVVALKVLRPELRQGDGPQCRYQVPFCNADIPLVRPRRDAGLGIVGQPAAKVIGQGNPAWFDERPTIKLVQEFCQSALSVTLGTLDRDPLAPTFAEGHTSLGSAYARQGLYDEAVKEYREASRIKPKNATARFNLGNTCLNQGKIPEAIAEFKKASKIEPDLAVAHGGLGSAYAHQGLTDKAIWEYKEALRLDPNDFQTHYNLAIFYEDIGKPDEAVI